MTTNVNVYVVSIFSVLPLFELTRLLTSAQIRG